MKYEINTPLVFNVTESEGRYVARCDALAQVTEGTSCNDLLESVREMVRMTFNDTFLCDDTIDYLEGRSLSFTVIRDAESVIVYDFSIKYPEHLGENNITLREVVVQE